MLCREVADSISWQRFCRIPLGGQVPHPTTLVKLTRRVGEQTIDALNQALLARAAQRKLLPTLAGALPAARCSRPPVGSERWWTSLRPPSGGGVPLLVEKRADAGSH